MCVAYVNKLYQLHRILLSFLSKLHISLNHFIQDDINTFYLINGELHKTYTVENNPSVLNYSLSERERGASAAQLFSQALWKVCLLRVIVILLA